MLAKIHACQCCACSDVQTAHFNLLICNIVLCAFYNLVVAFSPHFLLELLFLFYRLDKIRLFLMIRHNNFTRNQTRPLLPQAHLPRNVRLVSQMQCPPLLRQLSLVWGGTCLGEAVWMWVQTTWIWILVLTFSNWMICITSLFLNFFLCNSEIIKVTIF